MRIRWGSGVMVLAMTIAGCVPTPAGRITPTSETPAEPTPTAIPTPEGPTPIPSFVRPTPTPLPDFVLYLVAKGDRLSTIAKQFHTSARSIAYWNRVTYPSLDPDSVTYHPDRIEVGWVLQLIPGHEVDPENLPTLSPSPTPKPSPTPATPSDSGGPSPSG